MVYEARHSAGKNYALAGACVLLSILGFAVAGVIPTQSGAYPLLGWGIVAACFLAAAIFIKRALDRSPQARVDDKGVWSRRGGTDPVSWSEIDRAYPMRAGIQRIARFGRKGGKEFGINTTFYDRGINDLFGAVRHHRPDLSG
jgi:hypothetical protein